MTRSTLLGLGSVALLAVLPGPAHAICPAGEPRPEGDDVAVVGEFLEGDVEPSTGKLFSPAPFRVERYTFGSGPDEIEVQTAWQLQGEFVQGNSEGIDPRVGERWRIIGRPGRDDVIVTSICLGSERLSTPAPEPAEEQPVAAPDEPPPDPGDDRLLSLGVAAAGGSALALAMTRQPARRMTPAVAGPEATTTRAARPLRASRAASSAASASSNSTK